LRNMTEAERELIETCLRTLENDKVDLVAAVRTKAIAVLRERVDVAELEAAVKRREEYVEHARALNGQAKLLELLKS